MTSPVATSAARHRKVPGRDVDGSGDDRIDRQVARRRWGLVVSVALFAVACAASIALGSKAIPLGDVVSTLLGDGAGENGRIVLDLRIPRTIAGIAVGAGLGLAGAVIQALTRNPLGDPGLLGVNAGAAVAVVLGVVVFSTTSTRQDLGFALAGALVVTLAVALIGSIGGVADPVRLTLAGVAVAAALTGITTALTLLDPVAFERMRGWNAGVLVERGWEVIGPAAPLLVVGALIALGLARSLDAAGLGDDVAAALGARVGRTRALSVVSITLLAGAATAIAGPIAFVGLMVPHVARWIVGPVQRWILPLSILLGASLVLLSDVLGRLILFPGEVPVGVITAFVGAPILIVLVRRAKSSTL